jgi:hypothetical protein
VPRAGSCILNRPFSDAQGGFTVLRICAWAVALSLVLGGPASGKVPAIDWDWGPQNNSTAGNDAKNWLKEGVRSVTEIPDDANDNVNFGIANKPCNFGTRQNTLGKITVANTYTKTIKLSANTAFVGCSILGACTIDLNGKEVNFGNAGANPGVIGNLVDSIRPFITGGGSIEVTNGLKIDLANVTLGCSVNVKTGGTLNLGFVHYANDTTSRFRIDGGTVVSNPNAQFISSVSVLFGVAIYNQPIEVRNGGRLNFVTSTTVIAHVACFSGTVRVQGTQASPNVILTIARRNVLGDALFVTSSGVLNLAAGSTIQGNVTVYGGGMNLFDPPPGGTATVGTISEGRFRLWGFRPASAVLNLNNGTLNVSNGNVDFNHAAIRTNVAYGDTVRMGNVKARGSVTFRYTNTLTLSTTGTAKAFSLPLITSSTLNGDFSHYFGLPRHITKSVAGGTITLTGAVP